MFPAASVARTSKVWGPSVRVPVVWLAPGPEQAPKEPASTRHWKPAPGSEENSKVGVGSVVDRHDRHAKTARDLDHAPADASCANDSDGLARELEAAQARLVEPAAARALGCIDDFSRKRQEQCEYVLGNRSIAVTGHIGDGDAALSAIAKINVIVARRARSDH